jgi:tricorn protease
MKTFKLLTILSVSFLFTTTVSAQEKGYYRFPSVHNEYVVFTAEGDLWKYNQTSNLCYRITTHH